MRSEVAQLCQLCNPIDCSLPASSIHGIFQARVLEWVAVSFSRGTSRPGDQTRVSHVAGRRTHWATREAWRPISSYFKFLGKKSPWVQSELGSYPQINCGRGYYAPCAQSPLSAHLCLTSEDRLDKLCDLWGPVQSPERDGNTRPPDLPLEKLICRSGSNS